MRTGRPSYIATKKRCMNELMNENYTFHYHSYTVAVKITISVD